MTGKQVSSCISMRVQGICFNADIKFKTKKNKPAPHESL